MARIRLRELLLGTRIRSQAPRLRRAASRLWGLTAQRDRANRATVSQCAVPMPLEMGADVSEVVKQAEHVFSQVS
jgi:hypothetical protein